MGDSRSHTGPSAAPVARDHRLVDEQLNPSRCVLEDGEDQATDVPRHHDPAGNPRRHSGCGSGDEITVRGRESLRGCVGREADRIRIDTAFAQRRDLGDAASP